MKVLVFGGNGFIGQAIQKSLSPDYSVASAERNPQGQETLGVDLLNPNTIVDALNLVRPDVVINAAGVVGNTEEASQNLLFTTNILESLVATNNLQTKVIIMGSAAEYGEVESDNIPVNEDTPLRATSFYGKSKVDEELFALSFAKDHGIDLIVARIFNPLGVGMHDKFLVPQIIKQISEFTSGDRSNLEISRLDSKRDYLDVRDIASAIKNLAEKPTSERIYNVGSGNSTSNSELLDIILRQSGISARPPISETNPTKEPLVAIQADISLIRNEFSWAPKYTLEDTIKDIINAK